MVCYLPSSVYIHGQEVEFKTIESKTGLALVANGFHVKCPVTHLFLSGRPETDKDGGAIERADRFTT